ncbi:MAG: DUF1566 domain-containing protein [Anaerolineales bacterium]|nr:DUF1566 domain-containing protein [Anaerolineales bacterium]
MDTHRTRALIVLILACIFLAACQQQSSNLPETGQTQCYNYWGLQVNCVSSSQDGQYQEGVDWPEPRFTVISCNESGPCSNTRIDCDSNPSTDAVLDNLTGLMWARDGNLPGAGLQWESALLYIDITTNSLQQSVCGYTDWRLPNLHELESLIHFGFNEEDCAGEPCASLAGWLEQSGFQNIELSLYWTSTAHINMLLSGTGIYMDMRNGDTLSNNMPPPCHTPSLYLLPVREAGSEYPGPYPAPPWVTGQQLCYEIGNIIDCEGTGQDGESQVGQPLPEPRFTDNGDGTIHDKLSGLTWLADPNCIGTNYPNAAPGPYGAGMFSWPDALAMVEAINNGDYPECSLGHDDWRMPNVLELNSLLYHQKEGNLLSLPPGHPFDVWNETDYWSSTSDAFNQDNAWRVNVQVGRIFPVDKDEEQAFLWLVRIE